jgi:hypothetical protein
MTDFTFKAPDLFDAGASAEESDTVYEDAPGAGEALARLKRFAHWLHAGLVNAGLSVGRPVHDEGGWLMTVPAKSGFALICISIEKGAPFDISTAAIGSANAEVDQTDLAIEKVLEASLAVTELRVCR